MIDNNRIKKEIRANMTLGDKLKQLRIKYGYTQKKLAKKIKVTRQAVTKWENNRGFPDKKSLKELQSIFNVSIESLLDEEKEVTFLKKKNHKPLYIAMLTSASGVLFLILIFSLISSFRYKTEVIGFYISSDLNPISYSDIKNIDIPYAIYEDGEIESRYFNFEDDKFSICIPNDKLYYSYKIYKKHNKKNYEYQIVYYGVIDNNNHDEVLRGCQKEVYVYLTEIVDKIVIKSFDQNNMNINSDTLSVKENQLIGNHYSLSNNLVMYNFKSSFFYTVELYNRDNFITSFSVHDSLTIAYYMLNVDEYERTFIEFLVGDNNGV